MCPLLHRHRHTSKFIFYFLCRFIFCVVFLVAHRTYVCVRWMRFFLLFVAIFPFVDYGNWLKARDATRRLSFFLRQSECVRSISTFFGFHCKFICFWHFHSRFTHPAVHGKRSEWWLWWVRVGWTRRNYLFILFRYSFAGLLFYAHR